jgi:phage tail protein X
MDSGSIEILTLVGYADDAFSQPTGNTYTALFNPESFTITHATQNTPRSGIGASEQQTTFNNRSPQVLSFKLLMDGTGIIPSSGGSALGSAVGSLTGGLASGNSPRDVTQDVDSLKQVVYGYDSTTHMPPYVQVRWGKVCFNAQLQSMTITYKLFRPDGTPLRAEADCSFQGVIDDQKLAALENKQSPDLTHVRTVMQGDTLSLICYREYGDSKYYYQVAKFNRLTDFKNLVPGTKIILPPITNAPNTTTNSNN